MAHVVAKAIYSILHVPFFHQSSQQPWELGIVIVPISYRRKMRCKNIVIRIASRY
jgi:hypothetical protein